MSRTMLVSWALFVALLAAGACSRQAAPPSAAVTPASAAAPAAAQDAVETISGEVAETMDASTYTYLRVKAARGDVWVATAQTKVAVGEKVVVPLETEMRDWHSATLNRDFPLIYFVSSLRRGDEPPPPMAIGHTTGHAAAPSQAPVKVELVAPPAGGSSIADVWANRAALAGKAVTVRGTVVKFNSGIMDRNWIHLQDGSGQASDGTHDLTVTTDAVANVGDVVTITGTVVIDQDFGFGYAYGVILEKARIK